MKNVGQISKDTNLGGTQITKQLTRSCLGFGNLYNIQPNVGEFKKILPSSTMHNLLYSLLLN